MANNNYLRNDFKDKYKRRARSRSYVARKREAASQEHTATPVEELDIEQLVEAPMTYKELEEYNARQDADEVKIAVSELRKKIDHVNDLTNNFQELRSSSTDTEITFNRIMANIEKYHLQATKLESAIEGLHQDIEGKRNLISTLVDDENNLERVIAEYNLTKEELIHELQSREVETREAFGDLKDTQIALQLLKEEIEKYTGILKKEEFRYSQVHSHLHEHLEAKEIAEAKIDSLKTRIDQTQTKSKKENDEVIKLHHNANRLKKEFSHLKEKADFSERDLAKAQTEKAEILRAVFAKESELAQLEADIKKLETKKTKTTSDTLEAKQTVVQRNLEIETLKKKIETYKSEIITVSKNNSKASQALEGVKVVVREYQQKCKELEGKLKVLESQTQKRKHMLETLIEVKDNTIAAIQKIGRKIDFTSNENRELATRANTIDAQIIELKKNLENKKSQFMVARRNNDYLGNKVEKAEADLKAIQTQHDKYEEAYQAKAGEAKLKQTKINTFNDKISHISKELNEVKKKYDNFDAAELDQQLVQTVLRYENIKLELEQKRSQVLHNYDKIKMKRERIDAVETEITKAKMELADFNKKDTQLSRIATKDTQSLADKETELAHIQKDILYSQAFVDIGNQTIESDTERTLMNVLSQGAETQRSVDFLKKNTTDYKKLTKLFVNIYKSIDPKESFDCNFKINTTGTTVNFIVDNLSSFFDAKGTTKAIKTHYEKEWGTDAGMIIRTEEISDGLVSLHIGIDMKQIGLIARNEKTV